MRASVRARRAARSSGVPSFFFRFIVVVSLEVAENRLHVDVQVGECAHDGEHLYPVDPLLVVHGFRVPAASAAVKMAAGDTSRERVSD